MKPKVLVVDDDVVSRMMLMHLVDACGEFEIGEAEDGEDAWTQLEAGIAPAIVFCDLRMPRLSGLELLRRMRASARHAAVPFVLATSANDRETVEQAGDYGACGFIAKPLQPEQVRAQLGQCLGGAAAAAAGAEAPAATMRRLGIDAARLAAYLGGLFRQIDEGGQETGLMLALGERDAVRQRLARLREGCATLGLSAAAAALDACSSEPEEAALRAALAQAMGAVERQLDALRQLVA
ncbi:response regulator [Pseudoduganella sp. GCM10020061]|uniref:response regulator n=1 Tax=Pseudoduganella sp. GCM10020061 TaxID=3317345 RepID=UPI00363E33D8